MRYYDVVCILLAWLYYLCVALYSSIIAQQQRQPATKMKLLTILLALTQALAFTRNNSVQRVGFPTATTKAGGSIGRQIRVDPSSYHTTTVSTITLNAAGDDGDEQFAKSFDYHLKKDRLKNTYKATSLAYGAYALQNLHIHKSLSYGCLLASGHMLASGLAYILSKSTSSDNLFLYTTKRFNLALMGYGIFQLIVLAIAGRIPGGVAFVIGPVLATISSIQGYSFGVRGWDLKKPAGTIVDDLKKTTAQILSNLMKQPKNIKTAGYLGATLMLATMKLAKLKEIVEILLDTTSNTSSSVLVPLARFGRLAIFASVVYALKDGSDRQILDNSTNLIQLNILSSASFAALAAYVGISTPIGGLASFFSGFCGWNGISSILNKK